MVSTLGLLTLGCRPIAPSLSPSAVQAPPAGLQLSSVALPAAPTERSVLSTMRWRGQDFEVSYTPLLVVGQQHGEAARVSLIHDVSGLPLLDDDGHVRVCNSLDGATLLQVEGRLWSVVHGECYPGGLQLSELAQDGETGALSLLSTASVDLSHLGGGGLFCAADVSPWQSHLAGEEYEPPADRLLPDGTIEGDWQLYNSLAGYHRGQLSTVSPYRFGWVDELQVHQGRATVDKRFAMGRFSHELGRVMPDGRTVYLSDDGANGGFFVFIADREGDLSSGRLYASRWDQQTPRQHALSWIDLGPASEAAIAQAIDQGVAFADLIERGEAGEVCAQGFTRVRTTHERGCVRVVPGQEELASRLEARRYAAIQGATTELRKAEGMAHDPDTGRLWLALSRVERGLLDGDPDWDHPELNHLRMEPNRCGVVLELGGDGPGALDAAGVPMDSDWIVTRSQVVLAGQPVEDEQNPCDLEGISNPDNLAWIPGADLLVVAEDSRFHQHNALWFADLETGALSRVVAAPQGAELAGLNWFPDIGGQGYLTISFQHEDPQWMDLGEDFVASSSGVLGPFPAFD